MRTLVVALISLSFSEPLAAQRVRAVRPGAAPQQTWQAPSCDTVRGLPSLRFMPADGRFTAANEDAPIVNVYASAIAVTAEPNRLLAVFDESVYRSDDAGCNWWRLAPATGNITRLAAASGGAYAWGPYDAVALRITGDHVGFIELPEVVIALAVDPTDSNHLRAIAKLRGTSYESFDGGASWQNRGQFRDVLLYTAVVDPSDFDRILISAAGEVAHSNDGGETWSRTPLANIFELAISPADGSVVWAEGVVPGGRETVWRSDDGGRSFVPIAVSDAVTAFNRSSLAPHPTDAAVVAFPTQAGLAIADSRSNAVRVIGENKRWQTVAWSPTGETIYIAGPDVQVIVN